MGQAGILPFFTTIVRPLEITVFTSKKSIYIAVALLLVALGGAHAVANNQANRTAEELVNELVSKINENGGDVEVGEVTANPYNKNITVKDILVTDEMGRQHQIGMLTLSDIELNPEQDFIYAMNIATVDALYKVTGGDGTSEQEQALADTLQSIGIQQERIGHDQRLSYRYQPLERRISLNLQNQFYNPELPKKSDAQLFSLNMQTDFSQIPDLESQLQRLRNNEDMSTASAEWMQTGLISAEIDFEDRGSWQPFIAKAAEQAGISEIELKAQMKQQMQQQISALQTVWPELHNQLNDAVLTFIDSDTPRLVMDINSKNPQGTGLMLAFMSALMSPNSVAGYFDIQVTAE